MPYPVSGTAAGTAPHTKNAALPNQSPDQQRTTQKDNPTQQLIQQAMDCLIRQSEIPTTYTNFMAWLNALVLMRLEIAATSRRNCRAYRAEKGASLLQNQAVSVAPAADEQPLTALAAIIAFWCRKPVSLCISESSEWLIRHQPARTQQLQVLPCRVWAGARSVCREDEA
ncbi:MAG: hypothetical protein ABSB50_11125 [Terracidiphilus sp.]